jgi:hypothetical protein
MAPKTRNHGAATLGLAIPKLHLLAVISRRWPRGLRERTKKG